MQPRCHALTFPLQDPFTLHNVTVCVLMGGGGELLEWAVQFAVITQQRGTEGTHILFAPSYSHLSSARPAPKF